MEDFATSLLKSIKDSEANAVEKQRKIKATEDRVDELKKAVAAAENKYKQTQQLLCSSRLSLYTKKAENDLVELQANSLLEQIKVLDTRICEEQHDQAAQAALLTCMVDQSCGEVAVFVSSCGIVADKDSTAKRSKAQRSVLVAELKELEKCYVKTDILKETIAGLKSADQEVQEFGVSLGSRRELRDLLKAESETLMGRVRSLNLARSEGTSCGLAQQVKELQRAISELEQGGVKLEVGTADFPGIGEAFGYTGEVVWLGGQVEGRENFPEDSWEPDLED